MSSRFLLVLALFATAPASAQIAALPYAGYDFDAGNLLLGLGVEVPLPIVAPVAVALRASGEYIFPDDILREIEVGGVEEERSFRRTGGQVNLDVIARLKAPGLQPYGGAGVSARIAALDTSDDDAVEGDLDGTETTIGANLLGGVLLGAFGPVRPFVQARVSVSEETAFAAMGGIRVGF